MILNFLRLILLVLLIIIIFVDVEIPIVLNTPINQMIIAIIIIGVIVVIDEIIGFLLGVIFLIIYFKYYQKKFNSTNELKEPLISEQSVPQSDVFMPFKNNNDIKPEINGKTEQIGEHYIKMNSDKDCIEMPYISKELLDKAQTNIYDINNYNLELGMGQNDSYGIQGLNSLSTHYHAFDKTIIENNYI
jgi:hypothetical protein